MGEARGACSSGEASPEALVSRRRSAHGGLSIGEVDRVARRVNAATFSFGVAFGGCTFPGRGSPLFAVEPGRIEMGLGIHGERGIETVDWLPADQLAEAIVAPLLKERPPGGRRARVLLNGLGSTKYEELFVLYRTISRRLIHEGIEIVDPEVGEYVTSLDMAGCSLTLCWLDEETERLLAAPAAAPGFRTGGPIHRRPMPEPPAMSGPAIAPQDGSPVVVTTSARSTRVARVITTIFEAMADAISAKEAELGRLDSVAGDGDHGAGMVRGMSAAAAAAALAGPSAADVVNAAATAFSDAAGGASGALWGAGLRAFGSKLGPVSRSSDRDKEPALDAATVRGTRSRPRRGRLALVVRCRATRRWLTPWRPSSTHSAPLPRRQSQARGRPLLRQASGRRRQRRSLPPRRVVPQPTANTARGHLTREPFR
jgi:dihydroxyacetone kinase